jgi:hypothetical protein
MRLKMTNVGENNKIISEAKMTDVGDNKGNIRG